LKLPDANLLIALKWETHPLHAAARWFFQRHPKVATCPLTELALVRVLNQKGLPSQQADEVLADFVSKHRARLLPADVSATAIKGYYRGHNETTDSYLVKLAEAHNVKLVTLDAPLAKKFPDVVEFVETTMGTSAR
jgi:toxin-antitoxin system PIN domain toxin